jgi:uncharacterized protein (DUF433 family)
MTLTSRTLPSHIVFDEQGRAWVEGTGRKVSEIVIDHQAGLTAGEIHEARPDLPLAKIRPIKLTCFFAAMHPRARILT